MKNGYRFGVAWVAENDEPDDLDVVRIAGYVSTLLLADLAGKDAAKVACDVANYRIKRNEREGGQPRTTGPVADDHHDAQEN